MSPLIRLGDPEEAEPKGPPAHVPHLRNGRVEVGGIPTHAIWSRGEGVGCVLLHGWMDNSGTWLDVLHRLAGERRAAIAYDQPGFGAAPPLDPDAEVLDQLVDFAAEAIKVSAERSQRPVVVVGNSLGGWTALRVAERPGVPIAGLVLLGPAGIKMAPLFFGIDRVPAVSRIISMPAPVPKGVVRSVAGELYRRLAFGDPAAVDGPVVDRFTRHTVDRGVIRTRIDYAKRLRDQLDDPFDPDKIKVPVRVLWGDHDRLCIPEGAERIKELLPHAQVELIEGCGHTPQVECPDRVVAAIESIAS